MSKHVLTLVFINNIIHDIIHLFVSLFPLYLISMEVMMVSDFIHYEGLEYCIGSHDKPIYLMVCILSVLTVVFLAMGLIFIGPTNGISMIFGFVFFIIRTMFIFILTSTINLVKNHSKCDMNKYDYWKTRLPIESGVIGFYVLLMFFFKIYISIFNSYSNALKNHDKIKNPNDIISIP